MDKRYAYYSAAFILSLAILFTLSPYTDISSSKNRLAVAVEQSPVFKDSAGEIQLSTASFVSVHISRSGNAKILAEKNIADRLPIASLTKLMTAIIAFKNYHPEEIMAVSNKALNSKGRSWKFEPGEIFKVQDLLRALLIESNNDVAEVLSIRAGKEQFVEAMNKEARDMSLKDTFFVNPTGLDSDNAEELVNYSTAKDLFKIARVFAEKYPSLLNITSKKEYDLYTADGEFHHKMENTDNLLSADWRGKGGDPIKILGGKTGETPFAKQNLVLIVEAPNGSGYLINIVLGSSDRFGEMKKLVEWSFDAYDWPIARN